MWWHRGHRLQVGQQPLQAFQHHGERHRAWQQILHRGAQVVLPRGQHQADRARIVPVRRDDLEVQQAEETSGAIWLP